MSDIVKRLRNDASEGRFHNPTNPHSIFWDEIADEIERLRQRVAELERENAALRKDAECYHHLVGLIRANRNALAGEVLDWFTGESHE